MSRNATDFLQQEQEFEEEYKKNFADILNQNEDEEEEIKELQNKLYKEKLEKDLLRQKMQDDIFNIFLYMKKECSNYGYFDKLNFADFLDMVQLS